MVNSDRNKYRYFYGLLISAILPLSPLIPFFSQSLMAQNIRAENQVENNIIYVDSQVGSDRNRGERSTPLKTITQALKIAPANTIISLAPGRYNEASGETFPLIIKNSITLKGLTGGQGHSVIIEGNGSFISPTAAEQNVTIAAIRNAGAITGVTVTNPHSRGHGLWIESANPEVSYSTFARNGNTGLSVNGNSSPKILNNYFHNNGGNGLLIYGTSTPQVRDNLFESTGFGVSIVQNAAPRLENNDFKGNRIGIILEGNSQGILRNNKIANSFESGLVSIASSQVDMGNAGVPGNNSFSNNTKLDIQNITNNTISATGTTVSGKVAGKIDFSANATSTLASDEIVATNINLRSPNFSRLRKNPLPEANNNNISVGTNRAKSPTNNRTVNNRAVNNLPASNPPVTNNDILPPPPPVMEANSESTEGNKPREYVFAAPSSDEGKRGDNRVVTTIPVNNNAPAANTIKSSPLNNGISSNNVSSLSDLLTASAPSATVKYRVLVEANNDNQKERVKSIYPDAFKTVYRGKSMLQIGAFSDRQKAEIASRSLDDLGLDFHILAK